MKKVLSALLALVGISGTSVQLGAQEKIDANSILFSVPTISNDLAPMETVNEAPEGPIFSLHEDDWSQIEFFPRRQLEEVQRLLSEYKSFEEENREQYGWRRTYVRKIDRAPVLSGTHAAADLAALIGTSLGSSPILYSTSAITGRVAAGFSIALEGNITLYGYSENNEIPVLGVSVGENPDDQKLTQAFSTLNEKYNLFLVDWRQQLLILGQNADGTLSLWRP